MISCTEVTRNKHGQETDVVERAIRTVALELTENGFGTKFLK